jgi:hypothetical protein
MSASGDEVGMQRAAPAATAVLATALVVVAAVGVGVSGATVAAGDATQDDDPTAKVVARYPSDGEMVEEPVVTPDGVATTSEPQPGRNGVWRAQVQLTDDGAATFAETLVDSGFTSDGVRACPPGNERNDDGYCLLTIVDGEVVTAAGLAAGLAAMVESGGFEAGPAVVGSVAHETVAERAPRAFGWTPEDATAMATTTDAHSTTAGASAQTTTTAVSAADSTDPDSGNGSGGTTPGFGVVTALVGAAGGALAASRTG